MTEPILGKDTSIHFPHFIVLKASAGSGKTHALTERFVQFVLSEKIPRNNLRNILAVTFSNNAAKEMKERILCRLKSVCFSDPAPARELSLIVSLDRENMKEKAGRLIDEILDNYSDFQVKTIDSFLTTVFKASAIDFGYNPEFDILMGIDTLMEYSFNRFLRNVREGTAEAGLFEDIISIVLSQKGGASAYPWDPSKTLLDEIKKLYRKVTSTGRKPKSEDLSAYLKASQDKIRSAVGQIKDMLDKSGLDEHGNSAFRDMLSIIADDRFPDILGRRLSNPPVKKPKKPDSGLQASYNRITDMWTEVVNITGEYASLYSRSYYMPYLKVYEVFHGTIEEMKKRQGKIFIEDINKYLAEYLNTEIVPDIYFRIGETIFHFLIDEFQDTSPVQWKNLCPLLENSLSQGGSLFVVGDTKQAIYGFRDADYTIMKEAEKRNPFPSAEHTVKELEKNYRSLRKILDFNEKVFRQTVAASDGYREAGERSGLTDYVQKVKEDRTEPGYAEVTLFDKDEENPHEKKNIQELIHELLQRGFNYGDIAILTQTNENAVKVTAWLNEKDIRFISYSNLDIRRRKITGEIVSLLNFLDSPTDDLSFAIFILGDVFGSMLQKDFTGTASGTLSEFLFTYKNDPPLYKAFQKEFGSLWKKYFEGLFRSTGYLPLYDLVTEIFGVFRIFETMEREEAALVKMLEAVKEFEGAGYNSLRDFLEFAVDGDSAESAWNMDVPKDIDAVKVMTIHKSKGLGFPVAVVLLYEDRNRGFDYFFEESDGEISLLKINQKIVTSNPGSGDLYREEKIKDMVNRLNSLYVGFTRPEEELYVIGVKSKKEGYPIDLLPARDFPPSDKPRRVKVAREEMHEPLQIIHHDNHIEFDSHPGEIISLEEKRRGEFIHKLLFSVEYVRDDSEKQLEEIVRNITVETGIEYYGIKNSILKFLHNEGISEYFRPKPGRKIMREQEYSDGDGNLFRMDRVVIDRDRITVIDFKTGKDRYADEKYRAQMKTYMRILRGIYPDKNVVGIIAYVDLKEIRKIT